MLVDARDKFTARRTAAAGHAPEPHCLYLAEFISELGGAHETNILSRLTHEEYRHVVERAVRLDALPFQALFEQGQPHRGIYVIERGSARTFYISPAGREITLAYWGAGNFVGGPEVFSGGEHIWSCEAVEPVRALLLSDAEVRRLVERIPAFAIAMIEAMSAKGKVYSTLVQMLGTRSVTGRIAQLILILTELKGVRGKNGIALPRALSHEALANMVGATRQWVTTTLDRYQQQGILRVNRHDIVVFDLDALRTLAEA